MSSEIKTISTDDLRHMEDREGLILQGCGGDPREWVDGINQLLTDAGILLEGSRFEAVSVFRRDGLTNLLFPFDGVKLNIGKLAMWRLATHEQFGGTWLSDCVPNRLGGFVHEQERFHPPLSPDRAGREHLQPDWRGIPNPAGAWHGRGGQGDVQQGDELPQLPRGPGGDQ